MLFHKIRNCKVINTLNILKCSLTPGVCPHQTLVELILFSSACFYEAGADDPILSDLK